MMWGRLADHAVDHLRQKDGTKPGLLEEAFTHGVTQVPLSCEAPCENYPENTPEKPLCHVSTRPKQITLSRRENAPESILSKDYWERDVEV
jgi:hypothetical protein